MSVTELGTAYHEAGHAVVGLYFNFPVAKVSIVPDDAETTLGTCRHDRPPAWFLALGHIGADTLPKRATIEARIVAILAGAESQRLFVPDESPQSIEQGAVSDLESVNDLLDVLAGWTEEAV